MDNVILGLLLLQSRTIYQLRDRLNKGLNLMYSSSLGSIQAAIKKLLKLKYIKYEEIVENGKYKKVYTITEKGKAYFYQWINAPIDEHSVKYPELAKVYFMGFSNKENRCASIRQYVSFLNKQLDILDAIYNETKDVEIPECYKEIDRYQSITALYGKELLKFNIDWFEKMLIMMEQES